MVDGFTFNRTDFGGEGVWTSLGGRHQPAQEGREGRGRAPPVDGQALGPLGGGGHPSGHGPAEAGGG